MKMQILDACKIVLVTFICSALIMEVMKKIAAHIGAMDVPRADEGKRQGRDSDIARRRLFS